ncbi:IS30 family transposase [Actinoplanes sp. NPDC051633]|uniref:IS30 family transposase n=1 Tax=Actinoplanes sp. NPDC051633 TaxID=3155670 RepID=UPI0034202DCC
MFEIRGDRRLHGSKKLHVERQAFLDLVTRGVSTSEACRRVGVNRKTGHRWQHGSTSTTKAGQRRVHPPVARPSRVSGRYLSQDERIVIADRLRAGASQATIAAELRRSPGTISREVRRNSHPGSGDYRPYAAQQRADDRRPRPKASKIAAGHVLRELVQAMLQRRHSPEQISRRLRRDFPERSELHVSHETIYQALYVQGRGELRRELRTALSTALRTGRAVRRPRRQPAARHPRFVHPMVMISQRPAEADDRAVPGHWEGDLIIGKGGTSAIGTLVERSTRYVLLIHLGAGRGAEHIRDGLLTALATLPQHLKRSLTWDQGIEMALRHEFSTSADMPVYFCDPHSPWQRGSNENTNGLLRQYFPKGTDLTAHDSSHLAAVAAQLNGRPRKTLGWDTPAERLAKLLDLNL